LIFKTGNCCWKAARLDKAVPNLPAFQPSKRITGFDRQKRLLWRTRIFIKCVYHGSGSMPPDTTLTANQKAALTQNVSKDSFMVQQGYFIVKLKRDFIFGQAGVAARAYGSAVAAKGTTALTACPQKPDFKSGHFVAGFRLTILIGPDTGATRFFIWGQAAFDQNFLTLG
jgi:hypothetical protein